MRKFREKKRQEKWQRDKELNNKRYERMTIKGHYVCEDEGRSDNQGSSE
jgi:hypothetical protein